MKLSKPVFLREIRLGRINMEFKRALVTGGAGFIGSHLVDHLMMLDKEVAVIDNMRSGRVSNLSGCFNSSKLLFENREVQSLGMYDLFRIFRPEVVFHLAAIPGVAYSVENPFETNETNLHGTVNILKLAAKFGARRVVFSSSSSVYGGTDILPTPESAPLNPKSPYALQKKMGEEYCRFFSEHFELDTVCLRYFNVFGPRQYGGSPYSAVISSFAEAKRNNLTPKIYGDGKQFRDFCPVENVVSANLLAAECDSALLGEAFNVGCGGRVSVNELHKIMGVPEAEYLENRLGDVKQSCADISKISNKLGYKVIVPFKRGLERTLEWYLNI
jgi:UDP-glucose 4-epimerase